MGFKENLKNELSYAGFTVKELAARSGVKKQTIDNYLSSHNSLPSADAAVKIAKALNVSVEYLMTGNDKRKSHLISVGKKYSNEVQKIADDLSEMNEFQTGVVSSVINAIKGMKK